MRAKNIFFRGLLLVAIAISFLFSLGACNLGGNKKQATGIEATLASSAEVYTSTTLDALKENVTVYTVYSTGEKEATTAFTLQGDIVVAGQTTLTITAGEFSCELKIDVKAVAPSSIVATYTQGQTPIYVTDTLDSLQQNLVVNVINNDGSVVENYQNYTLSGTLAVGSSTITVHVGALSTTFTVEVSKILGPAIQAAFTQGLTAPFTSIDLEDLKDERLVVQYIDADGNKSVIAAAEYTLSADLVEGMNTVTVHYGTLTATFEVYCVAPQVTELAVTYTENTVLYAGRATADVKDNIILTATYEDETTKVIDKEAFTITGDSVLSAGLNSVKAVFGGKEAAVDFYAKANALSLCDFSDVAIGETSSISGYSITCNRVDETFLKTTTLSNGLAALTISVPCNLNIVTAIRMPATMFADILNNSIPNEVIAIDLELTVGEDNTHEGQISIADSMDHETTVGTYVSKFTHMKKFKTYTAYINESDLTEDKVICIRGICRIKTNVFPVFAVSNIRLAGQESVSVDAQTSETYTLANNLGLEYLVNNFGLEIDSANIAVYEGSKEVTQTLLQNGVIDCNRTGNFVVTVPLLKDNQLFNIYTMNLNTINSQIFRDLGEAEKMYVCGDGSQMYVYASASAQQFADLSGYYVEQGYTVYSESTRNGNNFVTYVKDSYLATLHYIASEQKLTRIVSSTAGVNMPAQKPAVTTGNAEVGVLQMNLTEHVNGLGYIIRLADGSFIVYDGGYPENAQLLYEDLVRMNGGPDNIIIRAWVLTHSHNDHYGCVDAFSSSYADKVTVEYFMVSLVNKKDTIHRHADTTEMQAFYHNNLDRIVAQFEGAKVCTVHSGMIFTFCNLKMEILYASEELYIDQGAPEDFNASCIISKVYSEDGYDWLFMADCTENAARWALNAFGAEHVSSYNVQMAHGGSENVTLDFYMQIQPNILWYPAHVNLYYDPERNQAMKQALEKTPFTEMIYIQYYDAYYKPWGEMLESITATYKQGDTVIYPWTDLETLEKDVVVNGVYNNGKTINAMPYFALSGDLTPGECMVTVTVGRVTTTIPVVVSEPTLTGIEAAFEADGVEFTTKNTLDDLKEYLVVKETYQEGGAMVTDEYELSGEWTVGDCEITVTQGEYTATFTVTVNEYVPQFTDPAHTLLKTVEDVSKDSMTYTAAATHYLAFNIEYLKKAFIDDGKNSIQFKWSIKDFAIAEFADWGGGSKHCYDYVVTDDGTTISHSPAGQNATFTIKDGYAIITIEKADYDKYFNENGVSNGTKENAVTLAIRFCALNADGNNAGGDATYYVSDVQTKDVEVLSVIDLDTDVGHTGKVSAITGATTTEIQFTVSASVFYLAFDMDFLVDAFVARNADVVTLKFTNSAATIMGIYNPYSQMIVYYTDSNGTIVQKVFAVSSYSVADGVAAITISKNFFTTYCNDDGTFNGAQENAYALGMRLAFTNVNGNAMSSGTFTLSDVTYETIPLLNVIDLDTDVGHTGKVSAITGATTTEMQFTVSASVFFMAFDMDYLIDAFVAQGLDSVTLKFSNSAAAIAGFYGAYPKMVVYYTNSDGVIAWKYESIGASAVADDGTATITIDKNFFTAYCNDDGTFNGTQAGAFALGMRVAFTNVNGNAMSAGTFTLTDVTEK